MPRIAEKELILPTLYIIENNNGSILTSDLIQQLREIMKPKEEDIEILKNRNDDRFSQKVRNLRSHRTLENAQYASYKRENSGRFKRICTRIDFIIFLFLKGYQLRMINL